MNQKNYNEMIRLKTFEERFDYLKIAGVVGEVTFGYERYINQRFYSSYAWKRLRNYIIVRDNGCDLGIPNKQINGQIFIHHIVPMTPKDLHMNNPLAMDPNNLICVSERTHQAIHYGNIDLINTDPIVRKPNDTCPWKG